jgi:hypothetical protein
MVAQNDVYLLMEKDNFSRFKKSDLFKQLMDEIDPYKVGVRFGLQAVLYGTAESEALS